MDNQPPSICIHVLIAIQHRKGAPAAAAELRRRLSAWFMEDIDETRIGDQGRVMYFHVVAPRDFGSHSGDDDNHARVG